jgi:heme-degrading monooxygenase HmoA
MFARNVHMQLKPNSATQFTQTLEKEVIPLLKKQQGFRDEIAFLVPNGGNETEAYAISFWESKEKADAYNRAGYPDVLKALAKVVEGTPQLQTYEVCSSTIQQIAARA